jgi:sentrin-specific protease 7
VGYDCIVLLVYHAGMDMEVVDLTEDVIESESEPKKPSISPGHELLTNLYPVELESEDFGGISLHKSEIMSLREGQWTPTGIVDFYMEHLSNFLKLNGVGHMTVLGSCWFNRLLMRLNEVDMDSPYELDCRRLASDKLRGWGDRQHFFDQAFIILPVIFEDHWSLLIVCHPGEVMNNTKSVSSIVHLDSMRGQHVNVDKCVRLYLFEEYVSEHFQAGEVQEGDDEGTINIAWSRFMQGDMFKTLQPNVPQQTNHYDCGMFVCHYAQVICEHVVRCSKNGDIVPNLLACFKKPWFKTRVVEGKRMHILDLIAQVARRKHRSWTSDEIKSFMMQDLIETETIFMPQT